MGLLIDISGNKVRSSKSSAFNSWEILGGGGVRMYDGSTQTWSLWLKCGDLEAQFMWRKTFSSENHWKYVLCVTLHKAHSRHFVMISVLSLDVCPFLATPYIAILWVYHKSQYKKLLTCSFFHKPSRILLMTATIYK